MATIGVLLLQGAERIKHSCDALGALLREIKHYTNSGRYVSWVLLVASMSAP